jgi:hypothetical protein
MLTEGWLLIALNEVVTAVGLCHRFLPDCYVPERCQHFGNKAAERHMP